MLTGSGELDWPTFVKSFQAFAHFEATRQSRVILGPATTRSTSYLVLSLITSPESTLTFPITEIGHVAFWRGNAHF